ncbi:Trafficking protein particle complex subunit 4 [Fasciolopsis buskii]|uniref:Trafficking protein particle complex subunit n=1 Tax=Fasciolopsis buskii TaxID=27845 RepID=A0A8E0RRX9_9TREM|nr:Trafficking protein particle complex subunit 4 [Fasciolopsis buski]
MSVFSVYVISESGSLQFYYEHTTLNTEVEKKFNFPLPFVFKVYNSRIVVDFGATEDVKIGYAVCAVDQIPAKGIHLEDGREILQVLSEEKNFPMTIKFAKPIPTSNDRLHLAGLWHGLHRLSRHLSPLSETPINDNVDSQEKRDPVVFNSGIQSLECASCRIHCLESRVGVKFLLITDAKLPSASREALKRIYEAYTDYVLKNPFYAPNQLFNYDFFTAQVRTICEQVERGIYGQG